ncbi:MAG: hypothetical protein FWH01_06775 [Oscillospiraceae bacterium]|nr:hypothetical protein [Oscillospiraceae bacterium]
MAKKEKKTRIKKTKEQKRGGGFLFAVVSLLSALLVIGAVLAGFLFIIVRMNVLGVADTYRDAIANTPVLNLALPAQEKDDPSEMTFEELVAAYDISVSEYEKLKDEMDGANKRIDELSRAKSEFDAREMINNERTAQLQQQLLAHEANKKQLDDLKYDLERIIATGDKEAFAKYFENVSPEVAQEIYSQIVQEQKGDDEKRKFIKLFEELEVKASAEIIETLGYTRIDFITDTLGSVKKEIAAEIIAKLTPELAAQITLRLSGN